MVQIPEFGPSDLLTSEENYLRRVKVETGSTSYELGSRFRVFHDFSDDAMPIVLKFSITKDIDLISAQQSVYEGWLRYRVFTGGVEGGVFAPIQQFRSNNKSTADIGVDSGMVVSTGGTLDTSSATLSDIVYLKTSGATGQSSTISNGDNTLRGFPATTAYVVIDQIPGGNNPPKGVLKYEWEVK